MGLNIYANTARFYDIGNKIIKYDYDIDFYKSFVDSHTDVLEIGCGTGRVTIPLLEKCKSITAMDLSRSMLDILVNKIDSLDNDKKNKINTLRGDMTNFSLNKKYDLVIFPGITFQSLTSDQDRLKCLANIKKHLKRDGKVIIDLFNPNINSLNNLDNPGFDFEYFDDKLDSTVKKYSVQTKHDDINQTISSKYIFEIYRETELIDTIEDHFKLGYMFDEDSRSVFKSADFTILDCYGWYDFSTVDNDNKKMLIYILGGDTIGN